MRLNPSEQRIRRCPTKRVYANWADAEAAAMLLTEDVRDGKLKFRKPGPVLAYLCDICGRWHIGHQPKPGNAWNNYRAFLASRSRKVAPR